MLAEDFWELNIYFKLIGLKITGLKQPKVEMNGILYYKLQNLWFEYKKLGWRGSRNYGAPTIESHLYKFHVQVAVTL